MKDNTILQVIAILYTWTIFDVTQCRPQESFVATTRPIALPQHDKISSIESQPPPQIVGVDIRSDIQFRYAKTVVKTYIKNPSVSNSQEVEFNMVLPDTAFISNFTIQIIGEKEVYISKVATKEDAKTHYDEAVQSGKSAGIVDADARYANKITIKSNLEAASKILFTLTYEEHLQRHTSKYEQIIHVNPGQIVDNFNVNVYINESLPVERIVVPEFKTHANEITSQLKPNAIAIINKNVNGNPNNAHVQFHPTPEYQKRMSKLSKREENGMVGQFIVRYDVDRKNQGNDIQVLDGYFVHFFAPDQLEAMQRHVVFVLDVSGSMAGTKLAQTKVAMVTILNDLSDQDFFNILTFSDEVYHWTPKRLQSEKLDKTEQKLDLSETTTSSAYQGTDSNRKEATEYIQSLETRGGTNINDGLKKALDVVENIRVAESIPGAIKPVIIFLTDGEATAGETNSRTIKTNVLNSNEQLNVPIYGLAFGNGADFNLLKGISTENGAFARKIYEASDASIQLEDFYQEIANPLLTDVNFEYVGESFQSNTIKKYNTYFKGGEFVVAGKIDNSTSDKTLEIIVSGRGKSSNYRKTIRRCQASPYDVLADKTFWQRANLARGVDDSKSSPSLQSGEPCITMISPRPPRPVPQQQKSDAENFIERLWAFLTIENILDEIEKDESHKDEHEEKALELALKYNFVTRLTSLYVVKPDNKKGDGQKNSSPTAVNPVPITTSNSNANSKMSNPRFKSKYPGRKGGGMRKTMRGHTVNYRAKAEDYDHAYTSASPSQNLLHIQFLPIVATLYLLQKSVNNFLTI